MALRAIGFDFGETLATYRDAPLNWASLYGPALARVAAALRCEPSLRATHAAEEVLRGYNTRLNPRTTEVDAHQIFAEALREWGAASPEQIQTAVSAFFGFFRQSLVAYDDTLSALAALRARGFGIGVLTDVPYGMPRTFVENDLRVTQIAPLVDVVLTSVDVGWRKPAPDGFRSLAGRLGARPDEMLYVGNEPKDIAGANAASMGSVLIDRTDLFSRSAHPPLVEPRFVIVTLLQLLDVVA